MKRLVTFFPPVLVMTGIWVVSSLSVPPTTLPSFDWDKLNHATAYFILTLSWVWTLARQGKLRVSQITAGAVALSIAYGALDEFHQGFVPGRQKDIIDLLADITGSLLGMMAYLCHQWNAKRVEARSERTGRF